MLISIFVDIEDIQTKFRSRIHLCLCNQPKPFMIFIEQLNYQFMVIKSEMLTLAFYIKT